MRKLVWILAAAMLLTVSCDKAAKEQLASLQEQKAALESQSGQLPPGASRDVPQDLVIEFDDDLYCVDAGGSVSIHYRLGAPASVEVADAGTWTASVAATSDTEGDIIVSVPDPALSHTVTVRAAAADGQEIETPLPLMLRRPFTEATSPRLDAMAYFGFPDHLATDENFQKLVEAGITMLSVEGDWSWLDWRHQCRLAEKYGIKVVLFIGGSSWSYIADPQNYKGLDQKILEAEQYPAVCAYQISDEPSAEAARQLKLSRDRIGELAPGHPTYINLHPGSVSQAGMGAATYEQYVEFFADICDLEFITFDQYPVFQTGVEDSWYKSLDVVRNVSRRHNIPFWAFLLCCREQLRADPTLENIRLQGNIDIAYGAQCIQYFVWKATTGTDYAPIMENGEYKPVYDDCKEYNREMHNREFVFAGGDVWKVRHAGIGSYTHGEYLSRDDLPQAIGNMSFASDALISFVRNGGSEYIAVCNKSWEEKLPVDITFAQNVLTIDRDGEFTEQTPGVRSFVLDEGDMLVIKWK